MMEVTPVSIHRKYFLKYIFLQQPAFEMGEAATSFLLQLIESKRPVTDFETRGFLQNFLSGDQPG